MLANFSCLNPASLGPFARFMRRFDIHKRVQCNRKRTFNRRSRRDQVHGDWPRVDDEPKYQVDGPANGVQARAVLGVVVVFAVVLALFDSTIVAWPRDLDGRYANSPLKQWFDQLASGKGMCCSFADGFKVEDVDWDTQDGRYRVQLHGQWIVVPDSAVVPEPNRFGPAVVWPYMDARGVMQIRCFLPGAGM